jgi:hypothetical protein
MHAATALHSAYTDTVSSTATMQVLPQAPNCASTIHTHTNCQLHAQQPVVADDSRSDSVESSSGDPSTIAANVGQAAEGTTDIVATEAIADDGANSDSPAKVSCEKFL